MNKEFVGFLYCDDCLKPRCSRDMDEQRKCEEVYLKNFDKDIGEMSKW